jgi:hypothetical protein
MSSQAQVVVRNPRVMRFIGVPLALVFVVGTWWAVIASLVHADLGWPFRGENLGAVGNTIGWVLLLLVLVASTYAAPFLLLFKETFTADGITIRKFARGQTLTPSDLTSIRTITANVRTGRRTFPFGRLVLAADPGLSRTRAILDETHTNSAEALDLVDGWVRARPEIVVDEPTRELFVSRGALSKRTD